MTGIMDGQIALVTGAGGGIGRAICKAMTEAGATVYATDLAESANGIEAAHYLRQDVTSADDWARVAGEIEAAHGRLDALVNNAGWSIVETIEGTSLDVWRKVQAINVESILHSLHSFVPMLRKAGESRQGGASVVNLSSIGGLRGAALNAAYCSAKGAVKLFTKSAAHEYGMFQWPIRVNSVHPGGIDTAMMQGIMERYAELGGGEADKIRANVEKRHPLGRLGVPEEIAGGVVFLCTPAASFMTGSELVMDGGYSAV